MIALTKDEIYEAIANISKIIECSVYNPNIPIRQIIFANYIREEDIGRKVKNDFQIYALMIDLRMLSFLEDSFLDDIDNQDLDLNSIKAKIFIEPKDANRFSNKQIIKFIRNAVSHSDSNKELFKISPNGRFVEIDLKNTKPIPFHVKIDYRDLETIIRKISINSECKYVMFIDRDKKTATRSYMKNYPKAYDIYKDCFVDSNYSYDYDESYKTFVDYCDKNKIEYESKVYNLTQTQISLISKYNTLVKQRGFVSKDMRPHYEMFFFAVILKSIIPLNQEKIAYLSDHLDIVTSMIKFPMYSYNKLCEEINIGLKSKDENDLNLSELSKKFTNKSIEKFASLAYAMSGYFLVNESIVQLLTFYYGCCCNDEYLDINGEKILKENLRNSLIHGRWFDDYEKNIVCFDTKSGKKNDYNFYWEKSIPLRTLLKLSLPEEKTSNNKKKI